jgi:cell wall-associated protease
MKKYFVRIGLLLSVLAVPIYYNAQAKPGTLNWYNGEGLGMKTDKAYKLLKGRTPQTVVVAVIDSGMDIEHEDLQGKIWVNTKEIPKNGKDDDGNGYVDDVHGWNFLGNSKGENLEHARLEKTRILAKLIDKYEGIDPYTIETDEEYRLFEEVKYDVENELGNFQQYMGMIKDGAFDKETANYIISKVKYHLNVYHDDRSLIGDNPDNFNDKFYGNGDVEGPDALHGTHVGGIIGAIRGNGKGGDGVADKVLLMSVRAVPDGDEFDKDVALAVRYAVDNGAQVINMSFGKAYSPHQKEVYEAFAYADSKGVLLVHAAGNDAKDVDYEPNFPTSLYDFQDEPLSHFVTVGASTRTRPNPKKSKKGGEVEFYMDGEKGPEGLVASFSNYGQTRVDVFAPGNEIYNSVPQSDYKDLQGTSMAAPMVAGVASMLKSYFPSLTMFEIKEIIFSTATKYPELANKCTTGGVVDVNAAVKACLAKEKAKK